MGIRISREQAAAMGIVSKRKNPKRTQRKIDPTFAAVCRSHGLHVPMPEFFFHASRDWRFDYAWTDALVALEVNGGVWTRGRHSRGKGQIDDMEKLNEAQMLGWCVLQVTPQQVESGEAFAIVKRAIAERPSVVTPQMLFVEEGNAK